MDPIPLSEAVAEIRRELKEAIAEADDQISLEVQDIELELTLEVTKHQGGGIGLSVLNMFNADGKLGHDKSNHHRIKLSLHPKVKDENGTTRPVNMSASDPLD